MGLAALHARFWSSPVLDVPWLARPEDYARLLDAGCAADPDVRAVLPDVLREGIIRGWTAAFARLPPAVTRLLAAPVGELSWLWVGLPQTLVHGDARVANFAVLPGRRSFAA
jgi:hypothetical protein